MKAEKPKYEWVRIPEWYRPPWWIIAYKIPPWELEKDLDELLRIAPDERFEKEIDKHTSAFIEKGVQPPGAIASAIYNIADDLVAGRQVVIRTGDYIAIQKYLRGM